jgi:hypothetical protein
MIERKYILDKITVEGSDQSMVKQVLNAIQKAVQ